MTFDAKLWLPVGLRIVAAIPTAIAAVEHLKDVFKDKEAPSQAKEDAAVVFVQKQLQTAEGVVDKDLVNDPAVLDAVRNALQAVVNVQNVVAATKKVKPAPAQ